MLCTVVVVDDYVVIVVVAVVVVVNAVSLLKGGRVGFRTGEGRGVGNVGWEM
jgi:hypothetical protein